MSHPNPVDIASGGPPITREAGVNVAQRLEATATQASRMARNAFIDLRYGGLLTSVVNSDYRGLDHIFEGRIGPDEVLVDVGCGRGRVINWWLHNGYRQNPIYGIELNADIADKTARRLSSYPNVSITAGDAVECLPPDATLIYLFNPFEEGVVQRFAERVSSLYAENGVRLLYYNCKHLHCFDQRLGFSVETVDLTPDNVAPMSPLAVIDLKPVSP